MRYLYKTIYSINGNSTIRRNSKRIMVSANLMILSLKGSVSCTVITLLPKLVYPYFLTQILQ
jgi:hypothetical protein